MSASNVQHRLDRMSGKAKTWLGRVTGDARRERAGRIQSAMADAKIKWSGAAKKTMKAIRERRANRIRH